MASTIDLHKGTRVLYQAAENGWREGELIRGSPNGEEWLVKNRFGQYWVPVTRLRPAGGPQPDH
jgi:hypothetical protein